MKKKKILQVKSEPEKKPTKEDLLGVKIKPEKRLTKEEWYEDDPEAEEAKKEEGKVCEG